MTGPRDNPTPTTTILYPIVVVNVFSSENYVTMDKVVVIMQFDPKP